ncbi:hypothetical protein [Geodermatophilus chilensis]|uniref:hypothetical protein n=1 Tax=Geodermatophilus chilensis TaxID=2035835 RepID=UPI000C268A75|nr:hypothetical protein [Geodermatophilus chilensis]
MVLVAGLLVLLGLGLFVGGIVTGTTALYWGCVAACGGAAVVLVVARLRMAREAGDFERRASETPARAEPAGARAPGTAQEPVVSTADSGPAREPGVRAPERPHEPAGATAVRTPEPALAQAPVESPAAPSAARPAESEPGPPVEQPAADAAAEKPASAAAAPVGNGHPPEAPPARRGAHEPREAPVDPATGEPGEEDVEVTDLLLVVDLADEVLVVDEHPRYHLAGCPFLEGREGIGLPMVEARTDGFTPCGTCRPVRHLADTERSRRQAARGN